MDATDRLILRWLFILGLTAFAFHRTLAELVAATRGETLIGYIWMVMAAGVLSAVAVTLQERRERPIHDRQTDIIVGTMFLVLALLLHGVLLPRYSIYFDLLRLDLFAMWTFLLGCTIMLFGIRPLIRYIWVWILLLAMVPLPYQIMVIVVLGGSKVAAAAGTLAIAAFAAWICLGHNRGRGAVGAAVTVAVGAAAMAPLALAFPRASVLTYQLVPSLSALLLTAIAVPLLIRSGDELRILGRRAAPPATKQAMRAVPVVAVVAVLLSLVPLPIAARPAQVTVADMAFGKPLPIPEGWHQTGTQQFPRISARLYGAGAAMLRQQITADTGNPDWDKLAAPRTVVIDTITTNHPFTFQVYPSLIVYAAPHARLSSPRNVDLGHGITGQLLSATDDKLLVTWNLMQWTWRNTTQAQRVLLLSVDWHDAGAPFPQPGHSLPTLLNALLVVLFRGNAAEQNLEPEFKDADMLTSVGKKLVDTVVREVAA